MAHGAVSQSMPIATAYDTLGEEGLRHSLVQTKAKAIFTDPHLLPTLVKPLKDATEIKYVIYNSDGEAKQDHIDMLKQTYDRLTVLSFEELRKLGQENPTESVPPGPEDLCAIMYTSGSTGPPKGVPLKHKAIVAASMLCPWTTVFGEADRNQLLVSRLSLENTLAPVTHSLTIFPWLISWNLFLKIRAYTGGEPWVMEIQRHFQTPLFAIAKATFESFGLQSWLVYLQCGK